MSTQVLHLLVFCLLGTFLTNSIIILEEKGHSFTQTNTNLPTETQNQKLENSLTQNTFQSNQSKQRLLQEEFPQIPTNNPDSFENQVTLGSKIKNLNLNKLQRQDTDIPSHFPDEEDLVYTSDLHIFSSLGIESGSKKMAFVKSKIEGNRKMIFEHNYSKKKSYMLAENKFIIYTPQEFREMYLTLKEPTDANYVLNQQITVISTKKNIRSLQTSNNISVNWKTARRMTSVKFQQTCGACYSFTPIAAIESAYMIYKNKTLNLAEQQIVDCSLPYENYGCIGGWNANSYKYIRDFGVLHESSYPYRADFGNCTLPANPFKYWIRNYVELANNCNVVIENLKNQPLSIAVNSQGWMYYSSGIYTDCRVGGSNHGVILAGVDQTSWLIKNSWGFTWGQNGYIRVAREAPNNSCNVCRWASYPVL